MKKYVLCCSLAAVLVIGSITIFSRLRQQKESLFIESASQSAVFSFLELRTRIMQGETEIDFSYHDAVCKFYALYNVVVMVADARGSDCPYKAEMNSLYGNLLITEKIDVESVDLIVLACKAIANNESHSSISERLLQAGNALDDFRKADNQEGLAQH